MGKMVGLEKPGFLLLSGHPQSGRVRKFQGTPLIGKTELPHLADGAVVGHIDFRFLSPRRSRESETARITPG
jgi:hypothetical protein